MNVLFATIPDKDAGRLLYLSTLRVQEMKLPYTEAASVAKGIGREEESEIRAMGYQQYEQHFIIS